MADKTLIFWSKAIASTIALVALLAISSITMADDKPFNTTDPDSGYMLAEGDQGEEGSSDSDEGEEGSSGGDEGEKHSCGGDEGEKHSCGDEGEGHSCGDDEGEGHSCGDDEGEDEGEDD